MNRFTVIRRVVLFFLVVVLTSAIYVLISPNGRQWITDLINQRAGVNKPPLYICPVLQNVDEAVATCQDCTFYPVDKTHALPASYTPTVVDTMLPGGGKIAPIARSALIGLFADAHNRGLFPVVTSAYRSYDDQVHAFGASVSLARAN